MPILNKVVKTLTKPLPRFLSPTAHAAADYLIAGSFLAVGVAFWSRSKRAALGAFISAGTELALTLLTDYPGGVKKTISFPVHRELDMGLAAMVALMPEFMAFKDDNEKAFFLMQGAGITAVTNLTDFRERRRRGGRKASDGILRRAA